MDEQTLSDLLRGFEGVWRRVSPDPPPRPRPDGRPHTRPGRPQKPPQPHSPPPPPPPPESEETAGLRRFLNREQELHAIYRALGRRSRGNAAFRRLENSVGQDVRRLQREIFLRTGDSIPPPAFRLENGTLPLLRKAYGLEDSLAEEFAGYAHGKLRELYRELARRAEARQNTVRSLIGKIIR